MNKISFSGHRLSWLTTRLKTSSWLVKVAIIALVMGGAWVAYTQFFQTTPSEPEYQTATAETGTIVVAVTASGQVTTANSGSVSTKATGVVKTTYVENGDVVKAGDKIALLDLDQTAKQNYTAALASYQNAQNALASAQATQYSLQADLFDKWNTYKTLAESDLYKDTDSANRAVAEFHIPLANWQAAEAKYKNQQAVIAQAQTALNSANLALQQASPTIYAPLAGTITGLALQPGTVLTEQSNSSGNTTSQKVASVVTQALPTVSVNLTEVDVTGVTIGDQATITVDALGDKTYTGQVISIDTVGSNDSGVTTYPAIIRLDTQVEDMFSNMSAEASIITDTKSKVVLVPASAIQTQNGQSIVRVIKDGQPQPVVVTTGLTSSTETEIISGVAEGDTVVTSTALTTNSLQSKTESPFNMMGGGGGGVTRVRIGG